MNRKHLVLSIFIILALLLGACSSSAPTSAPSDSGQAQPQAATQDTEAKGEILIGNLQDESGGMKALSSALTFAAQMKIEEVNQAGGINGRMLKLVTYDTRSDVNEAITALRRMVEQDKVSIVLGPPIANIGIAIAPVAEELKVPVVGLFMDDKCTIQPNGEPWTYMFLAQNSCTMQGQTIAAYGVKGLGVKNIAVLYNSQNSYSVGLAEPFMKLVEDNGGTIVAKETYTTQDKDFRAQLTKIKAANPDAIYLPSYPVEIPLILAQAHELGITVPMLGSNSFAPTALAPQTDPEVSKNSFYPYGINPLEPELIRWAEEYKKMSGIDPVAQSFSGADAFGIILTVIEQCGDDLSSECLTKKLNEVKDYQGFQGSISFSPETHQPVALPMYILTITDGKPEFVDYYTPEGPVK